EEVRGNRAKAPILTPHSVVSEQGEGSPKDTKKEQEQTLRWIDRHTASIPTHKMSCPGLSRASILRLAWIAGTSPAMTTFCWVRDGSNASLSLRLCASVVNPTSAPGAHEVGVGLGTAVAEELPQVAHLAHYVEVEVGHDELVLALARLLQDLAARVDEV